MLKRGYSVGTAVLVLLLPSGAWAQGPAIDHKPVGCLVVGQYPKFNACFSPTELVAKAKVYFRPEGAPIWYYVDMAPEAKCYAGALPKPTKKLVKKKVDYYLEVTDRSVQSARTSEYQPIVVEHEGDCKNQPPAAFATNGPAAVFPSVPAGFAAGAGIPAAVIAGGVAAAGAGVAIAATSGGGGSNTTVGVTVTTGSTAPPATPPVTPPPPPPTPPQNPLRCVPAFSISPDPAEGSDPLTVTFDMCATQGGTRKFFYDYDGDGTVDFKGNACSVVKKYSTSGISIAGRASTLGPITVVYHPVITAGCPDAGVFESRSYDVKVTKARLTVKALDTPGAPRRLAWVSQLDVPEARGQMVVNGNALVYAGAGRVVLATQGRRGENRIEAQIVQGSDRAGTWRFELGPTASFEPGTLRVIAGDVVQVTADSLLFRLSGKAGERVVFAFKTGQ